MHEVDHPPVPAAARRARGAPRARRGGRGRPASAGPLLVDPDTGRPRKFAYTPGPGRGRRRTAPGRRGPAGPRRARHRRHPACAGWPSGWRRSGCPAQEDPVILPRTSEALLPAPAGARRGAPLRDHPPPRRAVQDDGGEPPRRRARARRGAPQGAAAAVRLAAQAAGCHRRGDRRGPGHRAAHGRGDRGGAGRRTHRPRSASTPRPARSRRGSSGTRRRQRPGTTAADGAPGRAGRRHRHDRRRAQHRGQGAGGPRLLRRRQPAARAGRATWSGWSTRPTASSSRSRSSSTSGPGRSSTRLREVARGAGSRTAARRCSTSRPTTTCWSAVRRRPAGRTRSRRAAGCSTASPREREVAGRPARRRRHRHRHQQPQRPPADRPDRPQLRHRGAAARCKITVVSFGFKYGIPVDADYVADMRFLPNPYWVPELRAAAPAATRASPTTC